MNYIDITQNKTTSCVKNNTVVVMNREGIQGPPGRDGATPYIDRDTGTWCIAGMDTGVLAVGVSGDTPYINEDGMWCIGNTNLGVRAVGRDGLTPHIDPVTLTWIIGNVDTYISAKGVDGITPTIGANGNWFLGDIDTNVAAGLSKDDLALVNQYDSKDLFPPIGNLKDLYVDRKESVFYRWDEVAANYVQFKSADLTSLEKHLSRLNGEVEKLTTEKLNKPARVTAGALLMVDELGNTQTTSLTYRQILDKIQEGIESGMPTDLTPGSLLVGSDAGGIASSETQYSDLIAAIESVKKKVEFKGNIVPGSLVLADASGNIQSSGKTYEELVEELKASSVQSDWAVTDSENPAFIQNKPEMVNPEEFVALKEVVSKKVSISNGIVPGALMVADESGNISCSNVSYEDLVTVGSIVTGSTSAYVEVASDETYLIEIPEKVRTYPAISVYQNGKLLIEGVHYAVNNKESIILIGSFAYAKDMFNFIGYGSTTMLPGEGGACDCYLPENKDILDSITQERVDAWDTITNHHHDNKYVSKSELFNAEGAINLTLLPVATAENLGMVKSSEGVNKVTIAEDGTMSISQIDLTALVSSEDVGEGEGEDYGLILSSGTSISYKE